MHNNILLVATPSFSPKNYWRGGEQENKQRDRRVNLLPLRIYNLLSPKEAHPIVHPKPLSQTSKRHQHPHRVWTSSPYKPLSCNLQLLIGSYPLLNKLSLCHNNRHSTNPCVKANTCNNLWLVISAWCMIN